MPEMKFKIGDLVKLKCKGSVSSIVLELDGALANIISDTRDSSNYYRVKVDVDSPYYGGEIVLVRDDEMEKVEGTSQQLITEECDSIKAMMLEKNRKYKDSALKPIRIFSKSSPEEQIKVRADDKLNRIMNTDPDDEDSLLDLIGYLILLRVNRKMNKT